MLLRAELHDRVRSVGPVWRACPRRHAEAPYLQSPHGGPSFGEPMIGGVLHGQLTLPTPDGTYETIGVQRADLTKISSSALTVRSPDGFTKT